MKKHLRPFLRPEHKSTKSHRQRGITLLESLVALLISALGILGIVSMQMRTLADTQTTVRRAQAIRLIEDLSERMRVNPNALTQIESYVSGFDEYDNDDGPPDDNFCADDGCSPTEQAAYDIWVWKQSVKNLPLGQASIFLAPGETDADNRRQLGIIISWRENERSDADEDFRDAINAINSAGDTDDDNACPEDRICHLQYISVAARCAPYNAGGNIEYYCS